MSIQFRLQQPIGVSLTSTALLETARWEAEEQVAYMRGDAEPPIIQQTKLTWLNESELLFEAPLLTNR